MKFYIKSLATNNFTLMTDLGHVLGYFESITEALSTCNEWYLYNATEPRQHVEVPSVQSEIICENSTFI